MPLAPWMENALEEAIMESDYCSKQTADGDGIYCFGCGSKTITNSDGIHLCDCCGAKYSLLIMHRLVELHPHKKTDIFEHGYE